MEVIERSDGKTTFQCQVCGRESCLIQRTINHDNDAGKFVPNPSDESNSSNSNSFENGFIKAPSPNVHQNGNGGNSNEYTVTRVWLNFKVPLLCGACKVCLFFHFRFYTV